MLKKQNNGEDSSIPPQSPLTVNPEDLNSDAPQGDGADGGEGDAKEKEFSWGFEDAFGDDDDDDGQPAATGTPPADEPDKVSILEKEVAQLREQARIRQEFELLENKYGEMEGFPAVDKKKVMGFLQNDFSKMSPMEFGYILSNFGDIVKNARESGQAEIQSQYSPEVTQKKQVEQRQTAMSSHMAKIGENLRRRYGISKEE